MSQAIYILIAISAGLGSSIQTALIGSIGRSKGPFEAAWISVLASVSCLAIVLGSKAFKGTPVLPSPFDNALLFAGIFFAAATALFASSRGIEPYLAFTGVFGFLYLFSAALTAPRIGIALFSASITAGTMMGAIALDHFGAFGANVDRISVVRILGVIALMAGVVLIRGTGD